jgi:SAM-dependent methyltransferase
MPILDYDLEAPHYDATRGGEERAAAAAEAIRPLLPPDTRLLVDVACGTAIVSTRLRAPGRTVVGVDRSAGMLAHAGPRLDGAAVRGDAARLPLRPGSADAVTVMWLLHLVDDALVEAVVAECARVLRPGGVLVTTVDKNAAVYDTPSDLGRILYPVYRARLPRPSDDPGRVAELGLREGLVPGPEAGYVGHGQGRSPRAWVERLRTSAEWAERTGPEALEELCARMAALPEQDRPRPDPVYRLAVLTKR